MKKKIFYVLIIIGLSTLGIVDNEEPALKEIFKGHFLIGAAVNNDCVYETDSKAAEIVKKHFNTITAENSMKWLLIHPENNRYDFEAADKFVEFGIKNNMFIVGHTLIWHYQIPQSVFLDNKGNQIKRDTLLKRMREHIYTVVGRYKHKVNGWDVVNEAINDNGTLRNSKWLEIIGEDYISKAFQFANEADPDAELYYNDYFNEIPEKRDAIMRLVRKLKSENIRIDGVGIQGHWGLDYPDEKNFDAFVDSINALGLKVMITELDVDILPKPALNWSAEIAERFKYSPEIDPYINGLPPEVDELLANRYAQLFRMILKHKVKISRVTFWGITDRTSWLNNWPIRGRTNYPLLFDRSYKPKKAYFSIIKIVKSDQ